MGMELSVRFRNSPPTWKAVRDMLAERGQSIQVCMIDGELAFPDEQPQESWSELRLKTPDGMITVRRMADRVVFVTWGNVGETLLEQRNVLAKVFAECGHGVVEAADG